MKIKFIKMGMDIDEIRNHRIRGIVPTEDGKYLFIEILQGRRVKRQDTSLSKKEYEEKYPYEEYINIDFCFRVDVPEDYYKNYSKEYNKYTKTSFRNLQHTKENIIKLLQNFNKNITDIELTNNYYIDDFCNEKGFYELYDNRLQHTYEPIKIITKWKQTARIKFLYTCYSANGLMYSEYRTVETEINDEFMQKYGIDTTNILIEEYEESKKNILGRVCNG